MFFWTQPLGRRAFALTAEFAEASKRLAANQGLYNGFLAAGLLWGLLLGDPGYAIKVFFLGCVVIAGVFGALTIEENLAMGAYIRSDADGIKADIERVYHLFPRLRERRRQTAGTMSGGEQQMLAMGRAMMSRPKLLLLDEPSMGLAPLMVQKVFETIITISGEGVTILLIEQNAKLALEVSKRGYVMESGEVTLSGDAASLLHDPKVRAAYLGEAA